MKPICVPCQRFFRPVRTGYRFTEGMPIERTPMARGKDADEYWQPYKLWQGDLYRCEGCGAEIISGVAKVPVAERHHEYFGRTHKEAGYDQLQVNDC